MRKPRVARPRGRHRLGVQPAPSPSRQWDHAKKAAAAQLDQLEPGWLILYGTHSRRFVAMASWVTRGPVRVEASTIGELCDLMREAELEEMAVALLVRAA